MKVGFLTQFSEERVRFAREAGFDSLEIISGPGMSLDAEKIGEKESERIRKLFKREGIELSALSCYGINWLHPDRRRRKKAEKYFIKLMDLCLELGVGVLCTNIWGDRKKSMEENLPLYGEVFSRYAEEAERRGIKIAIENCPHIQYYPITIGNIGYSPSAWEKLFREVPSRSIGLEYDPSHLVWQQIDWLQAIYDFGERIYHVHAKDTEILFPVLKREGIYGRGWWRYRMPGWGEIDWKKVISALLEVKYKGALSIEHEDPLYGGEKRDEGLRLGLKHLRQFMV